MMFCCRVQRHPFERIATPFQVYSWTAPQVDHAMDCVRAEDAYTSRLGYEEHIPGQVGTTEHGRRADKEKKGSTFFEYSVFYADLSSDQRLERGAADHQRAVPKEPA